MTGPDAKEVSGAIWKLNRKLSQDREERIGINFYPAAGDSVTADVVFLRNFAKKKSLPMGVDGSITLHEISFHLSTVFVPTRVIDHGARITQRLLDFVDFAKKEAAGNRALQRIVREGALDLLLKQRAIDIDNLGNFSILKSSQIIGELKSSEYVSVFGDTVYSEFSANGASPNQYLLDITASSRAELSELVKAFIRKHPDPIAEQGLGLSHEEVLKLIDRKRGSIAKAVMSFSQ
jgi:hypothetical protein